ncbi:MAG TPA: hypothetical protein VGS58_11680 [Candidatus Sulfopaludibacter sp.]|nr:hypothetical protein [Candidatus Sulfopaludibacter sp.]
MNKRILIAGFGMLFAAAMRLPAQGNTAELYGGYAYAKAYPDPTLPKQNMSGWIGSATGYAARWFGASVEISAGFGSISAPGVQAPSLHFKEYSYLAGPQFRFIDTKKAQVGFKALIGGAFGQANLASTTAPAQAQALGNAGYAGFNQTKFAALFAVPVDFSLCKLVAIRFEPGLYLTDFSKTKESNFRFSIGPVFRFGGK